MAPHMVSSINKKAYAGFSEGVQDFPFEKFLRSGDRICFGQACSEPIGLLGELLRQGEQLHARFGRLKLLVLGSYSGLIRPEHSAWFDFESYGAFGDCGGLARAGMLELYPLHYSQLPMALRTTLRPDVLLLQLSAANEQGQHSLGVAHDFQLIAAQAARVVLAEINAQAPFSPSALLPEGLRIDHAVQTDLPLVEGAVSADDATSEAIAARVAALIDNGATLQMGIGSLMDAICKALASHRDLGVHSGILTDGLAQLMQSGVVNNTRKGSHVGLSVVGSLLGSRALFDFAHHNPQVCLAATEITHAPQSLALQTRFCSINSAVEVDLTGQVNSEVSGGRYIGAVGGQLDFIRAAVRSEGGLSIIALPSSARQGSISRIVSKVQGVVTTPRSDVDVIVTEWGVAHLRGRSLAQRARAMIEIAHPDHRDALRQSAADVAGITALSV